MEEEQLKAKLPDKCCTPFTYNKQTNNKKKNIYMIHKYSHTHSHTSTIRPTKTNNKEA